MSRCCDVCVRQPVGRRATGLRLVRREVPLGHAPARPRSPTAAPRLNIANATTLSLRSSSWTRRSPSRPVRPAASLSTCRRASQAATRTLSNGLSRSATVPSFRVASRLPLAFRSVMHDRQGHVWQWPRPAVKCSPAPDRVGSSADEPRERLERRSPMKSQFLSPG